MTDHDPIAPAPSEDKFSDPTFLFIGADGLRAGWGMLIFAVLFLLLSLATTVLTAKIEHMGLHQVATASAATKEQPVSRMILGEGSAFLAVLLTTFLMARIERRPLTRFGFGGTNRLPQFLQGLVWGAICLSLLVALLAFAGFLHFDGRLLANGAAMRYALLWAIGFTCVACFEESLTRGYLLYTLARGLSGVYGALFKTRHRHMLGFWTAALIFSALFGLGHKGNAGESPFGLVAAGAAGLVFCLALYRTGSLWWAIGFHAAWDWAQSFLYGVADSGTMVEHHLYATHPSGSPLLSGGTTGPEGSIFVLVALSVAAVVIVVTLPKTHRDGEGLTHPDGSTTVTGQKVPEDQPSQH